VVKQAQGLVADMDLLKSFVVKQLRMMDRSIKCKADVAQMQEVERGIMDLISDHVSIIHSKIG
jgi:hypothetical protein